jgi:hypothetical protein
VLFRSQVVRNAPALHSLIIRSHVGAEEIMEFLFHIRGYLRKLIFKNCRLGGDGNCLVANIVNFYKDLEVLSLEGCCPLTAACYSLIPCLKKLSELNLSYCKVHYVCVKL